MAKNLNDLKPVRLSLEILFEGGSRRVTPADVERAAQAAAVAIRTSLESRTPAYKIKTITGTVEYLYVQARKSIVLKAATKRLIKTG